MCIAHKQYAVQKQRYNHADQLVCTLVCWQSACNIFVLASKKPCLFKVCRHSRGTHSPCRTPRARGPNQRQSDSFNPFYGLHQGLSPAFRPRQLAQNTSVPGDPAVHSSTYSPHGAAAASERSAESMKATAELAEMLQRYRPWGDGDAVAAVEPQKATARAAMDDVLARYCSTAVSGLSLTDRQLLAAGHSALDLCAANCVIFVLLVVYNIAGILLHCWPLSCLSIHNNAIRGPASQLIIHGKSRKCSLPVC